MVVFWSPWLLCLVNLYLFLYSCEKQSRIVPLHFYLLLLVLVSVCTIFLSLVSPKASIDLCKYSIFTIIEHPDIMWPTVSLLFLHNLYLGSAPVLRILDWYTLVEMVWSCAISMKSSISAFRNPRAAKPLVGRWLIYITIVCPLRISPVQRFSSPILFHIFLTSSFSFLFCFFSCVRCCHIRLISSSTIWSWKVNFLLSVTTTWSFLFGSCCN